MKQAEYGKLLHAALRFFFLQRCGCAIPEPYGGVYAHPACHASKARVLGTDEWIDVSGGWHDAGDYGRYTVPGAKAVCDLLLAYRAAPALFSDDTGIPESGNGVPDILDEARVELAWLLQMQRGDGAVYHKVTCVHFCGFVPPHEETELLVVSPASTAATGDLAGAMALAYTAFLPYDAAFASLCLAAAKKAYAFLTQSPPLPFRNPPGIDTGEYDDATDDDERFFAAAALHAATGESAYAEDAARRMDAVLPLSLGWADVAGYGALSLITAETHVSPACRERARLWLLAGAERLLAASERDPFGISLSGEYLWGSNMYLANNAILLCEAYRLTEDARFFAAARRHLAYLLGENPLSMCYITGHCARSPRHPHHRPSVAAGAPMPGMLVGGPDAGLHDPCAQARLTGRAPAECYIDATESYSTNEVAVYWNSALVYLLALLGRPR